MVNLEPIWVPQFNFTAPRGAFLAARAFVKDQGFSARFGADAAEWAERTYAAARSAGKSPTLAEKYSIDAAERFPESKPEDPQLGKTVELGKVMNHLAGGLDDIQRSLPK